MSLDDTNPSSQPHLPTTGWNGNDDHDRRRIISTTAATTPTTTASTTSTANEEDWLIFNSLAQSRQQQQQVEGEVQYPNHQQQQSISYRQQQQNVTQINTTTRYNDTNIKQELSFIEETSIVGHDPEDIENQTTSFDVGEDHHQTLENDDLIDIDAVDERNQQMLNSKYQTTKNGNNLPPNVLLNNHHSPLPYRSAPMNHSYNINGDRSPNGKGTIQQQSYPTDFVDDTLSTPLLASPTDNPNDNNNNSNNTNTIADYQNCREIINDLRNVQTYDELLIVLRRVARYMGNYLAYCTLITMLILVPTVLYRALSNRKLDTAAINSAWIMVCGTVVLSFRLVYLHLTHWYMPQVQKYVVRILWMVPIYAIQSYLSLRYHKSRVYITTVRDFYEAYVIASFVYYLMELLGGQEQILHILHNKDPTKYGKHAFPFNLVLDRWTLGIEFLIQCKHGVLQYVVFKTTLAVVVFICEWFDIYGEGRFDWFVAYPYLCFCQNCSVIYALYCLVLFFSVVNEELRTPIDWHPLGKFLCIKGVVFFTWWQGVIIFFLKDHDIIQAMGSWTSNQVANGLIDYCIVIEMVGFAVAHSYTFTYVEYLPSTMNQYYTQFNNQIQQSQQESLTIPPPPPDDDNNVYSTNKSLSTAHYYNNQQQNDLLLQDSTTSCILSTNGDNNRRRLNSETSQQSSGQQLILLNGSGSSSNNLTGAMYRPPATLPKPMNFKEALWSSTVPKETIKDIKRLRAGVDGAINEANRERTLSSSQDNTFIFGMKERTSSSGSTNINSYNDINEETNGKTIQQDKAPGDERNVHATINGSVIPDLLNTKSTSESIFPDLLQPVNNTESLDTVNNATTTTSDDERRMHKDDPKFESS